MTGFISRFRIKRAGRFLLILLLLITCQMSMGLAQENPPVEKWELNAPLPGGYQKVSQYQEQIGLLPQDKAESVLQAKEQYIQLFSKKDDPFVRDQGFLVFRDCYYRVLKKLEKTGIPDKVEPKELGPYYDKHGYELRFSEGDYFLEDSPSFLKRGFGHLVSPMWQEFLTFQEKESKEGYLEEATLVIPWDKLRQRIVYWEGFLKKYPDFPRKDEVTAKIQDYLYVYMTGVNNSALASMNHQEGHLDPAVKNSYERFITANTQSEYHKMVSEYFQLLKGNDFKVGQYLGEFRQKQSVLSEENPHPWIGRYFGKKAAY